MKALYSSNGQINEQVRCIAALAFIKVADLKEAFALLVQFLDERVKFLASYVERYYIGTEAGEAPLFPMKMWNVHNR